MSHACEKTSVEKEESTLYVVQVKRPR